MSNITKHDPSKHPKAKKGTPGGKGGKFVAATKTAAENVTLELDAREAEAADWLAEQRQALRDGTLEQWQIDVLEGISPDWATASMSPEEREFRETADRIEALWAEHNVDGTADGYSASDLAEYSAVAALIAAEEYGVEDAEYIVAASRPAVASVLADGYGPDVVALIVSRNAHKVA